MAAAVPWWTLAAVCRPRPPWWWLVLYQGKNSWAVRPGGLDGEEAGREAGPVFQGLELRLGVRVVITDVRPRMGLDHARSASRNATGLEVIDEPRSAWRVSSP